MNDPGAYNKRRKALHDLRTPIHQIIGFSELLEEEVLAAGNPEWTGDLKKIAEAAKELMRLIEFHFQEPDQREVVIEGSTPILHSVSDVKPAREADSSSILVVDDNEMNRDLLSRRLTRLGYSVQSAEDGPTALRLLDHHNFDLILLDIMMPGMSGLEVLERLRQNHPLDDLPVIMATAMNASKDIVDALNLGANDYVTKPLDFAVVLARVRTQLLLKTARDQIRSLAEDLQLRNRFIQHTFGRYLSPEVVTSLLESPENLKLGGESRKVTILMSDLRGFSSVCERLTPEQIVRMLNHYLGAMTDIILKNQGTINEFIGDAVLAIFGAPIAREDDARRAIACAVEMQKMMAKVNELNREEGLPSMKMGIGLHTGDVVVGNIGSEERTKYGIVGPAVNLTARIESCTLPGQILVSQSAIEAAGDIVITGGEQSIRVKGFADPVQVSDVVGIAGEYSVFLEDQKLPMVLIKNPIHIQFAILEGKKISGKMRDAKIVKASTQSAEILSDEIISAHLNVKIDLFAIDGSKISGDLYGKVLEEGTDIPGAFRIQITSLSPEQEEFLKGML